MENDRPDYLRIVLGRNMVRLRAARQWTQEKLAHEAGLNRAYVGDVERADRNISIDNIQRIARAFGVPVVDLFNDG